MIRSVLIDQISFDNTIQCRANINNETVSEYTELWTAHGAKGTPFDTDVVLFQAGDKYFIGDGWHRCISADRAGRVSIPANVRKGGREAAVKYALSANANHGVRRTNADKRRAVEVALHEFPDWSNRQIATDAIVSESFVRKVKDEFEKNSGAHSAHLNEKPVNSGVKTSEPAQNSPKSPQNSDSKPAKVTGKDGKSYPAKKAPEAPKPAPIEGVSKKVQEAVDSGKLDRGLAEKMAAVKLSSNAQNRLLDKGESAIKESIQNSDRTSPSFKKRAVINELLAHLRRVVPLISDVHDYTPKKEFEPLKDGVLIAIDRLEEIRDAS